MKRLVVDLASSQPAWALPDWGAERLRAAAPAGWEVIVSQGVTSSSGDGGAAPSDETLAAVAEAEAVFGFGAHPALVAAAPKLRWIHSGSAGVGSALATLRDRPEIVLTNSAGIYAEAIADWVLAGVLHFLRGFDIAVRAQAAATWDAGPFTVLDAPMRELSECRVLIVGAGGIGSAAGRRFRALGASCTGVRRRPELGLPEGCDAVIGPDALDEALAAHDVTVLAAPMTAESRGLLDARRLALLPPGAIVVNVARGALIDETALLAALDGGRVRGAALDVFAREPLPREHPFWGHPRVLVTPHVSGVSPARHWPRALALFEDNWRRWVAGEPLRNVVDLDAGY